MSSPKRVHISILNPPPNCRSVTSLAHARRYVKRGLAEWEGGAIRFHSKGHRPAVAIEDAPILDWICDSGQCGFARYPVFGLDGLRETVRKYA